MMIWHWKTLRGAALTLGAPLALVLVISVAGVAQDAAECTIWVQPGESIQEAINQAPEGAVICLAEGTWEENITIAKSVTLRGEGGKPDEVRIIGADEGPVIQIKGDQEITSVLGSLTVAEGKGRSGDGIRIRGTTRVSLADILVLENEDNGLEVWDAAEVNVKDCTLVGNGHNGVAVLVSSQVTIEDSAISGNKDNGLWVGDSTQVLIKNSTISDNKDDGLDVRDSAHVALESSTVNGNEEDGIDAWTSGHVTVSQCTVSENGEGGLSVGGPATTTINDSTFSHNGGSGLSVGNSELKVTNSTFSNNVASGIFLFSSVRAEIANSSVFGNWNGISLWDTAQAEIKGNIIEDNAGCGIDSMSSNVEGKENKMTDNGADLCGNVPGGLRIPLEEATEEE
ncbi:right-handed parallel beta-helix repeat-containing protein, partial [Candidatus Bipolaricaulota bacterium]|nr:right-handed parallel beta-helix repeat-containing protein [Candidatus Bipolaricaulota bacterium]